MANIGVENVEAALVAVLNRINNFDETREQICHENGVSPDVYDKIYHIGRTVAEMELLSAWRDSLKPSEDSAEVTASVMLMLGLINALETAQAVYASETNSRPEQYFCETVLSLLKSRAANPQTQTQLVRAIGYIG